LGKLSITFNVNLCKTQINSDYIYSYCMSLRWSCKKRNFVKTDFGLAIGLSFLGELFVILSFVYKILI